VTDGQILSREILPRLWNVSGKVREAITDAPDWGAITDAVAKKHTRDRAEKLVLEAKISWYSSRKDFPNLIECHVMQIDRYGLKLGGNDWWINNMIYDPIFMHSDDRTVLGKALGWQEAFLARHPGAADAIDTYANLLYKLGRKEEAIAAEERAARIVAADAAKTGRQPDKTYEETLAKMRQGLPTWKQP
jgi:hypothetical protein